MSEHERSSVRPSGFSRYLRTLYTSGPLRDATRHIDIDSAGNWLWYCHGCGLPFALIEDKYRSSSPPWPIQEREWHGTRSLARAAGIVALAVAWTNDCRCGECTPSEMHVRVADTEGAIHETGASLERLLIRAQERHLATCGRRAA